MMALWHYGNDGNDGNDGNNGNDDMMAMIVIGCDG
jgi:hypothetical protein